MSMLELFRALWPEPPEDGFLTLWELPDKQSYHFPIQDFLKLTPADFDELYSQFEDHNMYFGHGLRCGGLDNNHRGGKKHVNYLPGWALDIDVAAGAAHKAQNLPVTLEDVEKILEVGPEPRAAVHTGNGYHIYWQFEKPLHFTCKAERDAAANGFKLFQKQYIDRAAEFGWHVDSTATIERVWRVPGFRNMKDRK